MVNMILPCHLVFLDVTMDNIVHIKELLSGYQILAVPNFIFGVSV